jgi:hypothetical protein
MWGYTLSNMYTVATGLYLIDLINFYFFCLKKHLIHIEAMFWVARCMCIAGRGFTLCLPGRVKIIVYSAGMYCTSLLPGWVNSMHN